MYSIAPRIDTFPPAATGNAGVPSSPTTSMLNQTRGLYLLLKVRKSRTSLLDTLTNETLITPS